MVYRFAENTSYEQLAAGGIIKSYKGHTNFPVRLGHEIYNRCLEYSSQKTNIKLYDPLCGSGYLLTIIGLLNFNTIGHIYGSDINADAIKVAQHNLNLLTTNGLAKRKQELQNALNEYKRDSYQRQLDLLPWYTDIVMKDKLSTIFQQDLFTPSSAQIEADIVIMDLPYDSLVAWGGLYDSNNLEQSITKLTSPSTIMAIISDKQQKLKFQNSFRRLEKFKVGKRVVEIMGHL